MSYPPSYHGYPGYPSAPPVPPSSNGYPSNSLGSGIGFESLMSPSQPANGYGQPAPPAAAPYPIAGSQMPSPGFRAPPPAPSPVETGQYSAAQGMPMPGPSPGMSMPRPMGFGGAANLAHAAVAFQAPVNRMPQVNPNPNTGFNTAPYRTNNSYPAGTPSVHPSSNAPPLTSRSSFHGPETKPAHPMNTAAPYTSRSSFHGFEAKPTYPAGNVSSLSPQSVPSNRGTVKPFPSFNAQVDAEALRKAIGGFGTNVKQIVNILCTRSNSQRLKIALEYKSQFGRDLITDLRYALAGSLENLILAMMQAPSEYDATELRKAMKGLGTNESVLIEILCSRTNAEIVAVKQAYRKKFDRDLEKDVHSETSGHFRKFLISLLQANRDEGTAVDYGKARADADALYRAGEKRWGTDEARFNAIFASRSYPQLRATFDEYAKICKYDIEKSVEREMSGDLKNAMTTLVQCVRNTPGYFATKLYKSMKGLGTDDATLIRIVVTRCEVDMAIIKQEFQKIYSKTLADFIKGDTNGNYCKSLLGLIGEGEK